MTYTHAHTENSFIYLFSQDLYNQFQNEEMPVGFSRGRSFVNFLLKQSDEVQANVKKFRRVNDGTEVIVPSIEHSY